MADILFFKNFKQRLQNIDQQLELVVNAEDLTRLREISVQIQRDIEGYKLLINNNFDLLWEMRNEYNEILAESLNSSSLEGEQYQLIDKKLKQLDVDINFLTKRLEDENYQEKIEKYESKLITLNNRIHDLERLRPTL